MRGLRLRLLASMGLLAGQALAQSSEADFFDIHTHYKWDQAEVTSPQQALAQMDKAGVRRAVVIGTPPELALELHRLAPERVVPFFGPYKLGGEKLSWQFRKSLVDEAEAAFASGQYRGIGELHLIGGMAVRWQRSKVFVKLMEIARRYDVPLMVHTEYASTKPTLSMCQENPENRFLLAHAGAVLPPAKVEEILQRCPNVTMDLAARDPWRFIATPIADEQGRLFKAWEALVLAYPDRFVVGSDTVWPVDKGSSWDEADTGWEELPRYVAFHRGWLSHLPAEVAEKIRWGNAQRLFAINR